MGSKGGVTGRNNHNRGPRSLRSSSYLAISLLLLVLYAVKLNIQRWIKHIRVAEGIKADIASVALSQTEGRCPGTPTFISILSWQEWTEQTIGMRCGTAIPMHHENGTRTSLPLFIILGEQKCGTTFLRTLLGQHPMLRPGTGIYGREGGETHFFDWGMTIHKVERIPELMMQSYARYFTSTTDEDAKFGFDTSPSYFAWRDDIPQRVQLLMPGVKMIVLVRDPVERYESALRMSQCRSHPMPEGQEFHTDGSMDAYLHRQPYSLHLTRGLYQRNLARWLEHFELDQLLVIESSELYRRPEATVRHVLRFLNLPVMEPDVHLALRDGRNEGCTNGYKLLAPDKRLLKAFYAPHNRELEKMLGVRLHWSE